MLSAQEQLDKMPLGFELVVSHPLGDRWPVYTAFGVTEAISNRKQFAEGEAGSPLHWKDFAAALNAIGAMPEAYYRWASETEKLLEPAPEVEPLDDDFRAQFVKTLADDEEFRSAVSSLTGGAA